MKTLIRCSTIVTLDPTRRVLGDGGIILNGNRIEAVLTTQELRELGPFNGKSIDATGLVAIPGFVQTHVHLCQTLFRGLADDLELLDWLKLRIFPFEAAHNSSSLRASARVGIAELLRSGTTTVMDMGTVNGEEEIVRSIDEMGMRAFVGKAMMDMNDHYPKLRESTSDSLRTAASQARTFQGSANGRIRYAFAPRFVLSCSEELLRETWQMVVSNKGTLLHTHAAENRSEMEAIRQRCGMDNIEYFHSIGMLGEQTCLAHCIHLNDREIDLMAEAGSKVLHCPTSNLKLGSGIANIPKYMSRGIAVSLGADGAPCNNNLNMFGEMRLAALLQKPFHGPTAMDAQTVLELATLGGAKTLGLEEDIGSIEAGKKADISLLDLNKVWNPCVTTTKDEIYSTIVYSATPANIHTVIVDGKQVVTNGQLPDLDEEEIIRTASSELSKLIERVEYS